MKAASSCGLRLHRLDLHARLLRELLERGEDVALRTALDALLDGREPALHLAQIGLEALRELDVALGGGDARAGPIEAAEDRNRDAEEQDHERREPTDCRGQESGLYCPG